MANSSDGGPASTIPTRAIHDAYLEALQARLDYQQSIGGPFEQQAHEALQDAVAGYFEVLRPHLTSSNATDALWNEEKLWPTEPVYQTVAICIECGKYISADDLGESQLNIGDYCPSCSRDNPNRAGRPRLEADQIPKTNEEGDVVYRYVRGLKSIDGIFDRSVERSVEYSDALGTHQKTIEETQLVPPTHLKTIAWKLDEALKELNLLGKVDDKLPTGGMTASHE
ncbi:MAG: hypothetical protein ACOCUO_01000 [archaeon]